MYHRAVGDLDCDDGSPKSKEGEYSNEWLYPPFFLNPLFILFKVLVSHNPRNNCTKAKLQ